MGCGARRRKYVVETGMGDIVAMAWTVRVATEAGCGERGEGAGAEDPGDLKLHGGLTNRAAAVLPGVN